MLYSCTSMATVGVKGLTVYCWDHLETVACRTASHVLSSSPEWWCHRSDACHCVMFCVTGAASLLSLLSLVLTNCRIQLRPAAAAAAYRVLVRIIYTDWWCRCSAAVPAVDNI